MWIDLSDDETTALLGELDRIVESDRYPFSPRIRTQVASAEPGQRALHAV
ncbi:MAG: hypothetical protein HRJ53_06555, partial [Acidobacteria bacterium Pan2503]|nr:hypothetical protein [Candidatus Acidoferrum panamensis]